MYLELIIGDKNKSSWSLRPWLLMTHFGMQFRETVLTLDTPEFYQGIGKYSPAARVPVLRDGDEMIWDSLAICEVINERYLDGRGWPADLKIRAAARSAVAEMHSGFAAMRAQLPFNCHRQADHEVWDDNAERDIARVQAIWRDLRSRFGQQGDFLCGEFGIVDAMFAPVCVRFKAYNVPMDEFAQSYLKSIYALPAMQKWQDDAALEVKRAAV